MVDDPNTPPNPNMAPETNPFDFKDIESKLTISISEILGNLNADLTKRALKNAVTSIIVSLHPKDANADTAYLKMAIRILPEGHKITYLVFNVNPTEEFAHNILALLFPGERVMYVNLDESYSGHAVTNSEFAKSLKEAITVYPHILRGTPPEVPEVVDPSATLDLKPEPEVVLNGEAPADDTTH